MAAKEPEYADDFEADTSTPASKPKPAATTAGGGGGGVSSVASSLSTLPAGATTGGGGGGGSVTNSVDTGRTVAPAAAAASTIDQKYAPQPQPTPAAATSANAAAANTSVAATPAPAPITSIAGGVGSDPNLHHYRVSIDFRSIRGLPQRYESVIARYSYPLFGSSAPVTTTPIPVPAHSEVLIAGGFMAFEFIGSGRRLSGDVARTPLIVQLIAKDRYKHDLEIGLAKIDLVSLLNARPQQPKINADGSASSVVVRTVDGTAQIVRERKSPAARTGAAAATKAGAAAAAKVMGQIRICCSFEDLGAVAVAAAPAPASDVSDSSNAPLSSAFSNLQPQSQQSTQQPPALYASPSPQLAPNQCIAPGTSAGGVPPLPLQSDVGADGQPAQAAFGGPIAEQQRQAMEYQRAWELELWIRQQKTAHDRAWKDMEAAKLNELEAEWKRRELARDAQLAKRQVAMNALEAKLKQALFDIEKQEKRLKLSEDELLMKQADLSRRYEDRKVEAVTTIKRVRDAHKHKVDLLLAKEKETNQRNEYLKSQIESWESRYRELEEDYRQYKLKTGKSTVGQLQIEIKERDSIIHLLQDEVARKTHDEQKTKAALQHSMAEYARLQKKMTADEEERLQRERLEVQRLRLQLMAKQEERGVRSDTNELYSIKRDMARLMEADQKPNTAAFAQQIRGQIFSQPNSNAPTPDRIVLRTDNVNGWVGPAPVMSGAALSTAAPAATSAAAAAGGNANANPFHTYVPVPIVLTAGGEQKHGTSGGTSGGGGTVEFTVATDVSVLDRELNRLAAEKDELLATEVYTEQHVLVRRLNQRIAELQKLRAAK